MSFFSILGWIVFGLACVFAIAGALFHKRLIAWENRTLVSLATAVRNYRLELEQDHVLLDERTEELDEPVFLQPEPQHFAKIIQFPQVYDRAA